VEAVDDDDYDDVV